MKKLRPTHKQEYEPRPLCWECEGTGMSIDPGPRFEPPKWVKCWECGGRGTR